MLDDFSRALPSVARRIIEMSSKTLDLGKIHLIPSTVSMLMPMLMIPMLMMLMLVHGGWRIRRRLGRFSGRPRRRLVVLGAGRHRRQRRDRNLQPVRAVHGGTLPPGSTSRSPIAAWLPASTFVSSVAANSHAPTP